jgi:hypothetical protein
MIESTSRTAAHSLEPAAYALERTLIPIIVGVVGKRKIADAATTTAVEVAIQDVLADLRKRYPSSPLLVLTALAEGADWCAARATAAFAESQEAGAAPVRLVCPLPLKCELYEQDFSPDHRKDFNRLLRYRAIKTSAGEVTLTPESFSSSYDRCAVHRRRRWPASATIAARIAPCTTSKWGSSSPMPAICSSR